MSQPIIQQIDALSRRARMLLIVHGLCWFVVVVVSVAFLFGWMDYFVRHDDRGVRVIISIIVAGALVWSYRRFARPALNRRYSNLEVAQSVERRFPQLSDRLSSTIEFLQSGSTASHESDELRKTIVSETEALAKPLDLYECLDTRATRRAILVCALSMAAFAAVCAFDIESASLAARRLAIPWSQESWPRWNSLQVVDPPERVALGHDVAIHVVDRRRRMPEQVTLQIWYDGDSEDEIEAVAMQRSEKLFRYERRNVTRDFKYRAIGGDDDLMEWHELVVVEPVQLVDLHISVEAPSYTGILPQQLFAGPIDVLQDSRLLVEGRVDRKIAAARIRLLSGEEIETVEATVAKVGVTFSVGPDALPTNTPTSMQYWIELVEADGVVSTTDSRWTWKVLEDRIPVVDVDSPAVETYFTSNASVPLRVTATDDIALRSVTVEVGGQSIPLFVGPDSAESRDQLPASPDIRKLTRALDLSEFDLQPNDFVELTFVAMDYKSQASEPVTRTLAIVSREEFDYRSQDKQKRLLAKLLETLRLQRATRSQVASLETQAQTVGSLSADDAHRLRASDVQQQQIAVQLSDQSGGAAQLVSELIADLQSNKVADEEIVARMNRLAAVLADLNQTQLVALRNAFGRAIKVTRDSTVDPNQLQHLLQDIGAGQDLVAERLQSMIDLLSQWDDYRRFAREVNDLLKQQQELSQRVEQSPTLGQRLDELTDQQRADLERAANEQLDFAKQFDRLRAEMARLRSTMSRGDSTAATALSAALDEAAANGIAEQMRSAGNEIADNRLGNAKRSQDDIEQGLERVLGALTDSGNRSGQSGEGNSAKQLAAALAELKVRLEAVAIRQQELLGQTASLVEDRETDVRAQDIASEQQALAGEVSSIREQLQLPRVFEFGMKSLQKVMADAEIELRARPTASVMVFQRQALTRIELLLESIDSKAKQPNGDAASQGPPAGGESGNEASGQQPTLSVQEIRLLHSLQVELLERTARMEEQRSGRSELSESDQVLIQQLASEQGELAKLLLQALPSDDGPIDTPNNETDQGLENDLDRALEEAGIPGF